MRYLFLALTALILFPNCGKKTSRDDQNDNPVTFELTPDERKWWISKVVRKLRGGEGISSPEELDQWMAKSNDQVVADLLNDPKFDDGLLDFVLFYLGFEGSFFGEGESLTNITFNLDRHAVAVAGVNAIKSKRDLFEMLGPSLPIVKDPYRGIFRFDSKTGKVSIIVEKSKVLEIRKEAFTKMEASANAVIRLGQTESEIKKSNICPFYEQLPHRQVLNDIGVPFDSESQIGSKNPDRNILRGVCYSSNVPNPQEPTDPILTKDQKLAFVRFGQASLKYIEDLKLGDWDHYYPTRFSELKYLSPPKVDSQKRFTDSWSWFWGGIPNSSTNGNRKRAAYFLKRFFCDDLTPINVVPAQEQSSIGRHGSDASCQSCHYKLDPMAGFFMRMDSRGEEVRSAPDQKISFSDGASQDLETYLANWRGKNRAWDVGYIRSLQNEGLNSYPAHPEAPVLEDLFDIIRKSPEAKECLTRRIYEFYVGEQQVADIGYLAHLTKQYNEKVKVDPADALKGTIKSIVMSRVFMSQNVEASECYDFAPNVNPENRPPCSVAYILEKSCANCHKASGASGGLNLERWEKDGNGAFTFEHRRPDGSLKPRKESLQLILDRLNAVDPNIRMPLNTTMSDQDRSALYLWVNEELKK